VHVAWGDTRSWLVAGLVAGGAILLSLIAHRIVFYFADRFSRKKQARVGQSFVRRAWKPGLFVFPLMALVMALPAAPFPTNVRVILQRVLGLGVIAAIGWTVVLLVEFSATPSTTDTPSTSRTISPPAELGRRPRCCTALPSWWLCCSP